MRTTPFSRAARTLTPWFAGACVGLLCGSLMLSAPLSMGRTELFFDLAIRYVLGGLLFLLPAALIVGLPLAHFLNARRRTYGEAAFLVAAAAVACGAVIGIVIGLLNGHMLLSLSVVIAAVLWCLAFALPLTILFKRRRPLAYAVIGVTVVSALIAIVLIAIDLIR